MKGYQNNRHHLEHLSQSADISLQATDNIIFDLKGDTLNTYLSGDLRVNAAPSSPSGNQSQSILPPTVEARSQTPPLFFTLAAADEFDGTTDTYLATYGMPADRTATWNPAAESGSSTAAAGHLIQIDSALQRLLDIRTPSGW